jgi:hypothetical protein
VSIAEDWALLGLAPTDDRREIKRAYSRVLKTIDVDADPAAFVRLREALGAAMCWGTQQPFWEEAQPDEPDPAGPLETEELLEADVPESERDFHWGEPWRPPLPLIDDAPLAAACARLDALLFDDDAPRPDAISSAGAELLATRAIPQVDAEIALERWMAQAIAASIPRSDPLIEPAAARFAWTQAQRHWSRDADLEWVMQRRSALAYLVRCERSDHPHREAVRELLGPGRRGVRPSEYRLIGKVEDFLSELSVDRPALEHSFPQENLAWWRSYLAGPHPPRFFWPVLAVGPWFVTLVVCLAFAGRGFGAQWVLLLYPASVAAVAAALLGYGIIDARTRKATAEGSSRGIALAGAALLLPAGAALLPQRSETLVVTSMITVFLFLRLGWQVFMGGSYKGSWVLPLAAAGTAVGAILTMPPPTAVNLAPLLIAACLVGWRMYGNTQVALIGWPAARRLRLLAAVLVLEAATSAALVAFGWPPPAAALALAPGAILAAHLASGGSGVDSLAIEWPIRAAIVVAYFATGPLFHGDSGLLRAVIVYGLLYGATRLIAAIRMEAREAARG